jgi:hypothetical protein
MGMEQAPEELLDTYDFDRRMMKRNATWDGLPVTLLKGGINGQVHFRGVGLVRYGAEKEAQIAQILATDPDRLDDGRWEMEDGVAALKGYFEAVAAGLGLRPE